jgi:exopolysaccharide biosynthesis polyprenyl glycosylphosphotransferase
MIEYFRKSYLVYVIIDVIFISISFAAAYLLRYVYYGDNGIFIDISNISRYIFIFLLWMFFIIITFSFKNLHTTDRNLTIPKEFLLTFSSIIYTGLIIGAVIFFGKYNFFSRQLFFLSLLFLLLFLSAFRMTKRLVLRRLIKNGFHNINLLIIGASETGKLILDEIKKYPWWGFRVVGFLDDHIKHDVGGVAVIGTIGEFTSKAKKHFVDEIIVTIFSFEKEISDLIKQARKMDIGIKITPMNFKEITSTVSEAYLGKIPLLTYKDRVHHPTEIFIKRLLDVSLALLLLIGLLPLFLLIAVLIRYDSPGPVFYVQTRMGLKGKLFNFYKFRSMVRDADQLKSDLLDENEIKGGVIFKIRRDPRITGVGKFLRRFSLDELPQLFNILKGDMSLVGPRPALPEEVKQYSHLHSERLGVRPGLTGLSQVRGRSDLSFARYVRWDIWYVNNWTFGLDFQILLWTVPAVLRGKGSY